MEIIDEKIQNLIISRFIEKGIKLIPNEVPQVFLKERIDNNDYIKLYYNNYKIILSEKYPDDFYWVIRNYILTHSERKKQTAKNILNNISSEVKKEMESIWFTADFHHGHDLIISVADIKRPTTIKDHERWLINDVINKYVKKKDRLFILGDLSLAKRKDAENFLMKLNGKKTLIIGNHDKNISHSTHFIQITQRKDFTFTRKGINIHIVLDHYPLASWNRKIHGSWQLYGHVHGRLKNKGLSLDVGIDNTEFPWGGYKPINLYEICVLMGKKQDYFLLEYWNDMIWGIKKFFKFIFTKKGKNLE